MRYTNCDEVGRALNLAARIGREIALCVVAAPPVAQQRDAESIRLSYQQDRRVSELLSQARATGAYCFTTDSLSVDAIMRNGPSDGRPILLLHLRGENATPSSGVSVQRAVSGNPFADHQQLRSIWHDGLQSHVEADTVNDLLAGEQDQAQNIVLLVCGEGEVIGITGVYSILGRSDALGLRWHGIVPSARNTGASAAAFAEVVKIVRHERPSKRRIIEYVEMRDPNAGRLIAHFVALGFRCAGEAQDATEYPAECGLPKDSGNWQAMEYIL